MCQAQGLEHKDHVWSYDLMVARTTDGVAIQINVKPSPEKYFRHWLRGQDDVRTFLEDAEEEIQIPAYGIPAYGIPA